MGRRGALPHGVRHAGRRMEDREERRDGERADRWAPHGSETRRWVGGRRAGLLKWAERPGGLRFA
jgi:hypothetical protein